MRRLTCLFSIVGFITILSFSCKKENNLVAEEPVSLTEAPAGFPRIPFTEENPYSIQKWKLGKKLFYENALSLDHSISCGSCHKASIAFSDDKALSLGVNNLQGRSNAPTLTNIAYHPYFTREGGVPTLEMQILVPIQEHDEFNFNMLQIAERLRQIPEYVIMSREAFGREPDAYVITRAIGIFERTLVSGNSAYDAYNNGNSAMLSTAAKRGKELFFSTKTNCSSCHSGFNFTNYSFENNGLHEVYAQLGRQRVTGKPEDNALFKVPTLRNIALTAPYMHDGSLATLEEVIEHYNSGGKQHKNKSDKIKPLSLTSQEKANLLAFLHSLTDNKFITNKNFQKPE